MKILFKSISLSYFKGIESLTINFNDGLTRISGDNGKGKTTIADAIFWVLFDKASSGATKFNQRTLDAQGIAIPNVENSVTLVIDVDGTQYSLKKQLITKADSYGSQQKVASSSTAKFFVDGQAYTKTDFNNFVATKIITEDMFRIITSPTFFFSLPWAKQREMLSTLVPVVSNERINEGHAFDVIEEILATKKHADIEALAKHVSYQISTIKKSLDLIPVQIEEQKRSMPDEHDWDKLTDALASYEKDKVEYEAKLHAISHPTETTTMALVRQQLEFQHKRIDDIKRSSRFMADKAMSEYNAELQKNTNKIAEYERSLTSHGTSLNALQQKVNHCNHIIAEQEKEQAVIREEWAKMVSEKFTPTADAVCPVCGQPLPYDEGKARAIFNEAKAKKKAELTERAGLTKAIITRTGNDIKRIEGEISVVVGQIEATQTYIANLKDKVKVLRESTPKSADELTAINTGYHDAMHRIEELEQRLNTEGSAEVDADAFAEVEDRIILICSEMDEIRNLLATKPIFLKHQERITQLEEEQTELRKQYDHYLMLQDKCKEYSLRASALLEQSINEKFSYVRFSLFRHLVNGDIEPYCTGTVNGVPYSDANTASRINAGIDVCNAFAQHFNISAPIIIDNSESLNRILQPNSQAICLYVSKDKSLTIN